MAELAKTPIGQARFQGAEERVTRALAERVEASDRDRPQRPVEQPEYGEDDLADPAHIDPTALEPAGHESPATYDDLSMPHPSDSDIPRDGRPPHGAESDPGMDVDMADEDARALLIAEQLGADRKGYHRERRSAMRRIVSEVFSPP